MALLCSDGHANTRQGDSGVRATGEVGPDDDLTHLIDVHSRAARIGLHGEDLDQRRMDRQGGDSCSSGARLDDAAEVNGVADDPIGGWRCPCPKVRPRVGQSQNPRPPGAPAFGWLCRSRFAAAAPHSSSTSRRRWASGCQPSSLPRVLMPERVRARWTGRPRWSHPDCSPPPQGDPVSASA